MRFLATALSVLSIIVLFVKGFGSDSLMSTATAQPAATCTTTYTQTTTVGPVATVYRTIVNTPTPVECKNCKLAVRTTTVTASGYTAGAAPVTTVTMNAYTNPVPVCVMTASH